MLGVPKPMNYGQPENLGVQLGQGFAALGQSLGAAKQQEAELAKAARLKEFQGAFGQAYAQQDRDAMRQLVAKYPEQFDAVRQGMSVINDENRAMMGEASADLRLAASTGNPESVKAAAARYAPMLEKFGTTPELIAESFSQSPDEFAFQADMFGLHALGPEKYFDVMDQRAQRDIQREGMDVQRRGQDITLRGQNIQSSLAAQRLAFDQEKHAFDMQQAQAKADELKNSAPELSVNMEKALDSAVSDATSSRTAAASMEELSRRWMEEKPTAGLLGGAQSTWNKMTGSDSGLRDLRIRTSQVLNSQALKFLPPGPATDRDVELAREGVPTNIDDPKLVSNWLQAQARNEMRNAAFNDFRAEWISAQGNPGQAKKSATIGGLEVNKGESFASAAKRFMADNEKNIRSSTPKEESKQQAGGVKEMSDDELMKIAFGG